MEVKPFIRRYECVDCNEQDEINMKPNILYANPKCPKCDKRMKPINR